MPNIDLNRLAGYLHRHYPDESFDMGVDGKLQIAYNGPKISDFRPYSQQNEVVGSLVDKGGPRNGPAIYFYCSRTERYPHYTFPQPPNKLGPHYTELVGGNVVHSPITNQNVINFLKMVGVWTPVLGDPLGGGRKKRKTQRKTKKIKTNKRKTNKRKANKRKANKKKANKRKNN